MPISQFILVLLVLIAMLGSAFLYALRRKAQLGKQYGVSEGSVPFLAGALLLIPLWVFVTYHIQKNDLTFTPMNFTLAYPKTVSTCDTLKAKITFVWEKQETYTVKGTNKEISGHLVDIDDKEHIFMAQSETPVKGNIEFLVNCVEVPNDEKVSATKCEPAYDLDTKTLISKPICVFHSGKYYWL